MNLRWRAAIVALAVVAGLSYYAFVIAPGGTRTPNQPPAGSAQVLVLDTTLVQGNGSLVFTINRTIAKVDAYGFANGSVGNLTLTDAAGHPEMRLQFFGQDAVVANSEVVAAPPYVVPEPGNWTATFAFSDLKVVHLEVWYTPG